MNLDDAKLISVVKIRNFAPISVNYDTKKISLAVITAQHEHVAPKLGQPLYDRLIKDVDENTNQNPGTAFTGDYKILVDSFLHPVILWAAYINLIYGSLLEVGDNGIVSSNRGPNGPIATDGKINRRIEIAEERLTKAKNRLRRYLLEKGSATFIELGESAALPGEDPDYGIENSGPGFVASTKKITNSGLDFIDDYNQNY